MACRGVYKEYAVIDCAACEGNGEIVVLRDCSPIKKEQCLICKGTCLVKVPLKEIPILNYTLGAP